MRLGLVLSEVGQGFRRNLSMVISVVLVTFISLTFFGAAILLQFQISQMKGYWYDRAQVAVYFCTESRLTPATATATEASADQIAAVKAELDGPTLKPYIKAVHVRESPAGIRRTSRSSSRAPRSSHWPRPTSCRRPSGST